MHDLSERMYALVETERAQQLVQRAASGDALAGQLLRELHASAAELVRAAHQTRVCSFPFVSVLVHA
jgi:hypothetical protein